MARFAEIKVKKKKKRETSGEILLTGRKRLVISGGYTIEEKHFHGLYFFHWVKQYPLCVSQQYRVRGVIKCCPGK